MITNNTFYWLGNNFLFFQPLLLRLLLSCFSASDSMWPHRRQPARLPRPWDSPGRNAGAGCHGLLQCMKVKSESEVAQSCLTLCDPIDGSPPGSPAPGILQAGTLEWAAISFSSAWKWKVKVKSLSRVRLLATPWTAAHQAPPSLGFSRQERWSGVPWPSPTCESEKWKRSHISRVWLLATPWTAAPQAPPSLGFSRQGYCSGVPWPSPFFQLLYTKCLLGAYSRQSGVKKVNETEKFPFPWSSRSTDRGRE